MKKRIYLFTKLNETYLSNTMSNNQLKHFTIQTSTNNESASANEDLNLLVEKDQNESAVKNEIMQNDDYMILLTSLIWVSELRNWSWKLMLEMILLSLNSDCWNDFIHNK